MGAIDNSIQKSIHRLLDRPAPDDSSVFGRAAFDRSAVQGLSTLSALTSAPGVQGTARLAAVVHGAGKQLCHHRTDAQNGNDDPRIQHVLGHGQGRS